MYNSSPKIAQSGLPHAFVRDASGNFSTPSVAGGTYGSVVRGINDQGANRGIRHGAR